MLITGIPPQATQIAFASSHRGLAFSCAPEQACTGRSRTYRTSDGGLTWRLILSSGEPRIFSVESVPNVVAWLSAGRSRTAAIHLHEQVGRAPTTVITVGTRLATIAFRTKTTAWGATDARAARGRFLVTTDGGRSWSGVPVNPCRTKAPATVRPVGVRSGFVVCVGTRSAGSQAQTVYRTTDNGRHWRRQTRRAGAGYAIRLTRSPDGRLWLTHARGPITVSADLGRHWTPRPDLSQNDAVSASSISFAGRKAGFIDRVCGGRADLLRSVDRGATWQAAPRAGTACAA